MVNYEERWICTFKESNFHIVAFCSFDAVWKNNPVWLYIYGIYSYILLNIRRNHKFMVSRFDIRLIKKSTVTSIPPLVLQTEISHSQFPQRLTLQNRIQNYDRKVTAWLKYSKRKSIHQKLPLCCLDEQVLCNCHFQRTRRKKTEDKFRKTLRSSEELGSAFLNIWPKKGKHNTNAHGIETSLSMNIIARRTLSELLYCGPPSISKTAPLWIFLSDTSSIQCTKKVKGNAWSSTDGPKLGKSSFHLSYNKTNETH
jgi:hypothetical protein